MKLIMAIIKPTKLDAIREALTEIGVQGLTASEVSGFGRQKGHTEIYRGAEYAIHFVPKMKIELVIDDGQLEKAINAIRNAANTEHIGDGKIFILDVAQAIRIRTGETGVEAL
ncbi:MAG: transcriptional regulator [Rhodospirillaceae bacterium]|nr:transcriptional regulator [Rhodospirillaceae bacterium]|tara:strand:- start:378 stop:716 length:339 start_codon:yes stop_codon:yes gene_type:complete